jgi:hypothetical protein
MTEAEWLDCTDPQRMLAFLQRTSSMRKTHVLFAACLNRARHLPPQEGTPGPGEVGERYLEEEWDADALGPAILALADDSARFYLYEAVYGTLRELGAGNPERAAHVALLRDIFGNPFRPVTLDPAWQTPQVVALARAAYDERELPAGTLDLARLAVLSDALEEAGCTDAAILDHCRRPGPHVRGCWVVDLILGKQ